MSVASLMRGATGWLATRGPVAAMAQRRPGAGLGCEDSPRPVDEAPDARPQKRGTGAVFRLAGTIDGAQVEAVWTDGTGLRCDPELSTRAEILIAMGETFTDSETGVSVIASLDEPLAAMLTCLRAMNRITSVELATTSSAQLRAGSPAATER